MAVVITDVQLPDKCCKCSMVRKNMGICSITNMHIFDTASKPAWCPIIMADVADANMLRKTWTNEPEVLESIEKAVIA